MGQTSFAFTGVDTPFASSFVVRYTGFKWWLYFSDTIKMDGYQSYLKSLEGF